MLFTYQKEVQQLIADETTAQVNPFDLTLFINAARSQIAVSTGCLRSLPNVTLTANLNSLPLASIAVASPLASVIYINEIASAPVINAPFTKMESRPWPWFFNYYLANNAAQTIGQPTVWSQLSTGSTGLIYFNPNSANGNILLIDCVCTPINLALDGDPEALPYPFTHAVRYFATYLAFMNMKNMNAAQGMLALYHLFLKEGTSQATPTVLPSIYSGSSASRIASQAIPNIGVPTGR